MLEHQHEHEHFDDVALTHDASDESEQERDQPIEGAEEMENDVWGQFGLHSDHEDAFDENNQHFTGPQLGQSPSSSDWRFSPGESSNEGMDDDLSRLSPPFGYHEPDRYHPYNNPSHADWSGERGRHRLIHDFYDSTTSTAAPAVGQQSWQHHHPHVDDTSLTGSWYHDEMGNWAFDPSGRRRDRYHGRD